MRIAGHDLTDEWDARCSCGRAWADLADVTEDQIGQNGIAHAGALNRSEYESIVAERARRAELADRIWNAVAGVSAA